MPNEAAILCNQENISLMPPLAPLTWYCNTGARDCLFVSGFFTTVLALVANKIQLICPVGYTQCVSTYVL